MVETIVKSIESEHCRIFHNCWGFFCQPSRENKFAKDAPKRKTIPSMGGEARPWGRGRAGGGPLGRRAVGPLGHWAVGPGGEPWGRGVGPPAGRRRDPLDPLGPMGPMGPISPWAPLGPMGPRGPIGPCGPVAPMVPTYSSYRFDILLCIFYMLFVRFRARTKFGSLICIGIGFRV